VALSRYPVPLVPDPSESLISVIHRLSEENGYKDALALYDEAGIHHLGQEFPRSKIDVIAEKSGLDVIDLVARQTERLPDQRIRFFGADLRPDLVERQHLRFCLRCLQEFGFHRLIWELASINTCPLHQIPLISNCPSCGELLMRRQKNIFICRKGHDLREIHLALSGPVDGGLCVAAIYEKCGLGYLLSEARHMPTDFQTLALGEFIATLLLLGRIKSCILHEEARGSRVLASPELLRLAADALIDWPTRYCADLASLRTTNQFMRSPAGKQIQGILCYSMRRGIGAAIAKATYEFASSCGFLFPAGAFGYRPEGVGEELLSIDAAAKIMRVDKRRVKAIAMQYHWSGWQGITYTNHCLLHASDVYQWRDENRNLVAPNIVAKKCGCSEELVRELVARGVFGSVAQERCSGDRFGQKMIAERELKTFVQAISASVCPAKGKHISWRGFKRTDKTPIRFADLLSAILERRIRPCSWDGHTLISLRYERAALDTLASDFLAQ